MYYHGGSKNHGCEAIVRSTKKILNLPMSLYTSAIDEDKMYGVDSVINLQNDIESPLKRWSLNFFRVAFFRKLFHNDCKYIQISHNDFFKSIGRNNIYLSVGGDNYCYKGRDILGYYNNLLHRKGAKTVLWGCSFEPADMTDEIAKDIRRYNLIVARERISYDVLKSVNHNTVLLPDPAFQLDKEELPLPEVFQEGNTIGLNVSPLVLDYADGKLIFDNYRMLMRHILDTTECSIALIPHVVKDGNDDRTILTELYQEFKESERIVMIKDCNCMQLKGYISRCRMFVGARTHATIAAYSTCVPTLVAGYSVKAIGIARELFSADENYVVPVQALKSKDDLTKAFVWMQEREVEIRNYLQEVMPEYKARILKAKELIEKL